VARRYAAAGLLDVFVLDREDEGLSAGVRALGLEVVVTQTVMTDAGSRAALARDVLGAAAWAVAVAAEKRLEGGDATRPPAAGQAPPGGDSLQ
jgi:hypothetical protein